MSENESIDPKAKFKAVLDSKKKLENQRLHKNGSEDGPKVRAARGSKPKMFRRKSG